MLVIWIHPTGTSLLYISVAGRVQSSWGSSGVLAPEEKPGYSTCLRCDAGRAGTEEGWQFPISDG